MIEATIQAIAASIAIKISGLILLGLLVSVG